MISADFTFFSGAHAAEKSLNERDESPIVFFRARCERRCDLYTSDRETDDRAAASMRGDGSDGIRRGQIVLRARHDDNDEHGQLFRAIPLRVANHENGAPRRAWIRTLSVTLQNIASCSVQPCPKSKLDGIAGAKGDKNNMPAIRDRSTGR